MAIQINGNGTITGISVGGLPDGIVDTDMLAANAVSTAKIANNAVTSAKATGLGISMVDQWRINSEFTFSASGAVITSNWERVDTDGFGQLGTGMTESSGVFSFPTTGIYSINFFGTGRRNSGNDRYGQIDLQTTADNSSYGQTASFYVTAPSQYNRNTGALSFIMDVTDVSNQKFRFFQYEAWGTLIFQGSTNTNYNGLTVLRLGDT